MSTVVVGLIRYAHLSQEHKKKAVQLLNGLTSMSQNVTKPDFSSFKASDNQAQHPEITSKYLPVSV